tara:strand:- start:575 stop:919 length:345 start_codon:yes stop_codon:yes gene_type:complete
MYNEKELLILYHTSIRNVALFTSVSLALLSVSRYYRGKLFLLNFAYLIFSLLFLLGAILICISLINTIDIVKKQKNLKYIEKIEIIPKLTLGIDIIMGLFIIFTLIRQILKSYF